MFSLTKEDTSRIATAQVAQGGGPRSSRSSSRRSAAPTRESLKSPDRLVVVPSASGEALPSPRAVPNSSSLLFSSVPVNLPRFLIVQRNCPPWPAKFSAVESSRLVRAPLLLAPSGPSATVRSSMLW